MKVVLASSNPGKIRELQIMLSPFNLELVPQNLLHVTDIPETGKTFVENALLKARHACDQTGLPAIADDSGISVDALNGMPGIYSARFAGDHVAPERHINKILEELVNVPTADRTATFNCVLVFMTHAADPTPLICYGQWEGFILQKPQGTNGFGYDPIFYVPSEKKSAAELAPEIKNRLSHRGKALKELVAKLTEKLQQTQ
jgi:XTP/dITP diphosphohydrolase